MIALQQGVQLGLAQPGNQHLADGGGVNRQAAADARIGDGGQLAFNLLDIDPFTTVQIPRWVVCPVRWDSSVSQPFAFWRISMEPTTK